MKLLAQFGIFIRIMILNIGGKNAYTHFFLKSILLSTEFLLIIINSYFYYNERYNTILAKLS